MKILLPMKSFPRTAWSGTRSGKLSLSRPASLRLLMGEAGSLVSSYTTYALLILGPKERKE